MPGCGLITTANLDRPSASRSASSSRRSRTALICHHAMCNKVIDQRNRTGGKMFRHRGSGKLVVVYLERGQNPPVVLDRLARPALDRGEHRFGRVTGNLRHQLGKLWRVGGNVDGSVELVVQANGPLVVIAGIGLLPLGLGLLELIKLIIGDVDGRSRGQLAAD